MGNALHSAFGKAGIGDGCGFAQVRHCLGYIQPLSSFSSCSSTTHLRMSAGKSCTPGKVMKLSFS